MSDSGQKSAQQPEVGGAWTLPVSMQVVDAAPRISNAKIAELTKTLLDQSKSKKPAGLIVITEGIDAGKVMELVGETGVIIGSSEQALLRLNDESISHQHCEVIADKHQHKLINLAFLSGTWVNQQRIRSQILKSNDVIRLGNTELIYVC
ncbi:MAG: FHA domain-containing protein [Oleibacter sp.]|nr:FHA domain-containing protein [Thalassolituus sp.]